MTFKIINKQSGPDPLYSNEVIADFLHEHLEQYRDKKSDILKALEFVFVPNKGGHIVLGLTNDEIVGAVVINETGMSGYIPENILVYIAIHKQHRGKGLGKQLMQQAISAATGNIALHVEPDNPAFHLYKKLGFTNKYLEMRFDKSKI